MLFCAKNKPIDYDFKLRYGSCYLERVSSHSFLGVKFHHSLGWSDHIDHTRVKIARAIGMLSRLRDRIPCSLKRQFYFSLIHSRISYCLLIWGTCNKTDLEKISALQSRAARFLLPAGNNTNSCSANTQSRMIPVKTMYELKICVFIYNEIKSNYINFFNTYQNRSTGYSLRQTSVVVNRPRTNYGTQSIEHQILLMCNSHPFVIDAAKNSSTPRGFKRICSSFFLFNVVS